MDQSLLLDAIRLINSSTSILLVLPPTPSLDLVAATASLTEALRLLQKPAVAYSPLFSPVEAHNFLPLQATIVPQLTNLREFIIRVGLQTAKLESLRYETTSQELALYLLPKTGYFDAKDVHCSSGTYAYDLILTLGVADLTVLGNEANEQRDFFVHTPTIALDYQPAHQRYAQVNLVDLTATSVSEITHQLIQHLDQVRSTEPLATTLLAGIMSNTKGFQAHSVTPKALAATAALLNAGARRDFVVRNLYQTKTVPVLKLWGKALARLQLDAETGVAYTTVTRQDLQQTGTNEGAALGLLDELLAAAQETVVALLVESPTGTDVHVVIRNQHTAPQFPDTARQLSPQYTHIPLTIPPAQSLQTVLSWWKTTVPA